MSKPIEQFDWSDRDCPLPVVRKHIRNDRVEARVVEMCGALLHVEYSETRPFLVGGEIECCGPTWKVVCEGGHVLFLPDHEGDDNLSELPFDAELAAEVTSSIEFADGPVAAAGERTR